MSVAESEITMIQSRHELPKAPSAFCEKVTKIIELCDNLLEKDAPSINTDYWISVSYLYHLKTRSTSYPVLIFCNR
jgi:hypothetical protein